MRFTTENREFAVHEEEGNPQQASERASTTNYIIWTVWQTSYVKCRVCVFSLNDFVLRKIIGSCFFFFQFVQFFVAILMIAIVVVAIIAAGVALHLHSVRSCNILKNVYIVGLFHLFSLLFVRIFLTLLPMLLSIVRSCVLLWCRHMCTNMRIWGLRYP